MTAERKIKNCFDSGRSGRKGFSIVELVIVLLLISIVAVFALPQIIASRRMLSYWGMQRETVAIIVQTRQEAMSQRRPITVRYDDANKRIVVYGGNYGALGAATNLIQEMSGGGLDAGDIMYGRPGGASTAALDDGTNITNLTLGAVEITFQGDGSVRDASDNPEDNAIFFYHNIYGIEAAFAVSVLGSSGRTKLWRCNPGTGYYVE
ncbi:MAG: prepilin-type N-terminal cleavage/methylation domain-containing protein [Pyrinomonadaceae bacterium]|nr:prepilin-type N-terminal cleavage/methylation domain-containing protein [Pyrinomonadaceae bacterium]